MFSRGIERDMWHEMGKSRTATKFKAENSKKLSFFCFGHALNLSVGDLIKNE